MNITHFGERDRDPTGAIGAVSYKVSAILIAVLLPVVAMLFSVNVIFRMPDLYSFEFDRSEVTQELGIDVSAQKLSTVISNYMLHKTDEFALVAESNGKDIAVFSITDAAKMDRIRDLMDISFAILCISFPIVVALFVIVRLFSKKRYLKYACRAAWAIFGLFMLIFVVFAAADDLRHSFTNKFLGVIASSEDIFSQLFTNYFRFEATAFVFIVSTILLGILVSVGRRFYRDTKMFA
jgi:hypothetical protein